ncbi:MAG: hypothetical protein A2Y20_01225 [Firmicutes bacterium GWF2_51_9]|nr:MAG: hypothetical protein A2Y20_01225 [Firmicutes bacterium GWF2_51_9]OGS58356.1 MAG: hypothetical protein A2Y19_08580 [Firmicutes bacterium GWE2_51_13]HAM64166.1 hypothetical protein [Erysipelotrichaceae bacterium]HBZ40789.1 hypothetical protein [Erysipelotrichaceae bacterium]
MTESNSNLRVLLVSPLPPPAGGIASWTKEFLVSAKEFGISVDIVNIAVTGRRKENINSKASILDEIFRTLNVIFKLQKKISFYRPTVVHLNTPCGKMGIFRDYLCAQIIRLNKVKLVVHYRCNIEDQIGKRKLQSLAFRKLANSATINLVLNSTSKSFLESETRLKSRIIANFIEDDFLINVDKPISDSIRRISFIGHIKKSKGIHEIIEVARMTPNIKYSLAGPVSDVSIELDCPENIEFLGIINKDEVKLLLDESDVFLFPTHSEGFSNALLEAMARGVPIITTSVGANQSMIEDHGGVLVNTMEVESILEAINALEEIDKRIEISKWNVEKVKKSYKANEVFGNLLMIYKSVETKQGENQFELHRENL